MCSNWIEIYRRFPHGTLPSPFLYILRSTRKRPTPDNFTDLNHTAEDELFSVSE